MENKILIELLKYLKEERTKALENKNHTMQGSYDRAWLDGSSYTFKKVQDWLVEAGVVEKEDTVELVEIDYSLLELKNAYPQGLEVFVLQDETGYPAVEFDGSVSGWKKGGEGEGWLLQVEDMEGDVFDVSPEQIRVIEDMSW